MAELTRDRILTASRLRNANSSSPDSNPVPRISSAPVGSHFPSARFSLDKNLSSIVNDTQSHRFTDRRKEEAPRTGYNFNNNNISKQPTSRATHSYIPPPVNHQYIPNANFTSHNSVGSMKPPTGTTEGLAAASLPVKSFSVDSTAIKSLNLGSASDSEKLSHVQRFRNTRELFAKLEKQNMQDKGTGRSRPGVAARSGGRRLESDSRSTGPFGTSYLHKRTASDPKLLDSEDDEGHSPSPVWPTSFNHFDKNRRYSPSTGPTSNKLANKGRQYPHSPTATSTSLADRIKLTRSEPDLTNGSGTKDEPEPSATSVSSAPKDAVSPLLARQMSNERAYRPLPYMRRDSDGPIQVHPVARPRALSKDEYGAGSAPVSRSSQGTSASQSDNLSVEDIQASLTSADDYWKKHYPSVFDEHKPGTETETGQTDDEKNLPDIVKGAPKQHLTEDDKDSEAPPPRYYGNDLSQPSRTSNASNASNSVAESSNRLPNAKHAGPIAAQEGETHAQSNGDSPAAHRDYDYSVVSGHAASKSDYTGSPYLLYRPYAHSGSKAAVRPDALGEPIQPQPMSADEQKMLLSPGDNTTREVLSDEQAQEAVAIIKRVSLTDENGHHGPVSREEAPTPPVEDEPSADDDQNSVIIVDEPAGSIELLESSVPEHISLKNKELLDPSEEDDGGGVYAMLAYAEAGLLGELPGLEPSDPDDHLYENAKPPTRVKFSTEPIKVYSTFAENEYDRTNSEVDPVGASAEYELEKRIEKMDVFPVDIHKGRSAQMDVFPVDIHKGNEGLGFSIIGMGVGADAGLEKLGIFIKTLVPGGVAGQDGRMQVCDQIIEVDGKSLVGVTQSYAASVIRNTSGNVHFVMGREKNPSQSEVARLIEQSLAQDQLRGDMRRREQKAALLAQADRDRERLMKESSDANLTEESGADDDDDDRPSTDRDSAQEESQTPPPLPFKSHGIQKPTDLPVKPQYGHYMNSTFEVSDSAPDDSGESQLSTGPNPPDHTPTAAAPAEHHVPSGEGSGEASTFYVQYKDLQNRHNQMEADMVRLNEEIAQLRETELEKERYREQSQDLMEEVRDFESLIKLKDEEIKGLQEMLDSSKEEITLLDQKHEGEKTVVDKKYSKAKRIIKDLQQREKEWSEARDTMYKQYMEVDQQYNDIVFCLKNKVAELESELAKTQNQAGLPVSVVPGETQVLLPARKIKMADEDIAKAIDSLSISSFDSEEGPAGSLGSVSDFDKTSLSDLNDISSSSLLDTQAQKDRIRVGNSGGIANRRPPSSLPQQAKALNRGGLPGTEEDNESNGFTPSSVSVGASDVSASAEHKRLFTGVRRNGSEIPSYEESSDLSSNITLISSKVLSEQDGGLDSQRLRVSGEPSDSNPSSDISATDPGSKPMDSAEDSPSRLPEWSPVLVARWLTNVGLSPYAQEFMAKGVDGKQLGLLDAQRLKQLGLSNSKDRDLFKKKYKELKLRGDKERKALEKESKLRGEKKKRNKLFARF